MKSRRGSSSQTSARMAVGLGLFLPFAETIRRIHQILDFRDFFSWFDDYILGAILVTAAYAVFRDATNAISYLIAAWGIATGAVLATRGYCYYAISKSKVKIDQKLLF